jgi:peptide/nickel transport system substrate-binding protein
MRNTRHRLAALLLVGAGAASLSAASAPSQVTAVKGGTYRVGWEGTPDSFWGRDGFDPTVGWEIGVRAIHTNLVIRTLVGYDHVPGVAGTRIVPDLASAVPAPTNGGRTYTFRLKRGVRFGPPVNREITSRDVRYAIERLARPANGAISWPYFAIIDGLDAYRAGKAGSIRGIGTPNAKTIRFTLTRPAGDFLHRMALPAAAPMPGEVARCFEGRPGAYTSDVVSSGPYMIEGAGSVRIGSCREIRPMRGISRARVVLVRNPSYDPRTDRSAARESNPDRFVFVPVGITPQLVAKLTAGDLEDAYLATGASSRTLLLKHAAAARKRGALRLNPARWVHYMTLNLTQPPFDDVHVRRAMSWVIDRAEVREAFGGAQAGAIAGHIIPDDMLGGRLAGYAPFDTPGDRGSLARAKAEMAKSKYKTRNGVCIASACKGVFFVPLLGDLNFNAGERFAPVIKANAAEIGIGLRQSSRWFDRILTPSLNLASSPSMHWYPEFPDPSSFIDIQLARESIAYRYNPNTALVGITPALAARVGVKGRTKAVPSVDADIVRCSRLTGGARLDCYAALDRKLTEGIVPWIPLLWRNRINILGPQVAKWQFDGAAGMTAYAHVAVKR